LCIRVAVSQVGHTNPTYLPKAGFPGQTEATTNALWSSGKQPARLSEWPQSVPDTTSRKATLLPCWQVHVLRDATSGWPGMCRGLFRRQALSTREACQSACVQESRCPMWQFTIQETPNQCWLGYGENCHDSNNTNKYIRVGGAQRLQHGQVRVLATVANFEILNMYHLGILAGCSGQDCITRCRDWCYSDIGCQYWQHGANGCYVDAPYKTWPKQVQYPMTTSGISTTSSAARTMIAGEYIQHYCPPAPAQAGITLSAPIMSTAAPGSAIASSTDGAIQVQGTMIVHTPPTLQPTGSSGSPRSRESSGFGSSGNGSGLSESGSGDSGLSDASSSLGGSGILGESSGAGGDSSGTEWWLWALVGCLLLLLALFCVGLLLRTKRPTKKKKTTRAMDFMEEEGPLMQQPQQPAPGSMYAQPPVPIMYTSLPSPVQQQTPMFSPVYVAHPTTCAAPFQSAVRPEVRTVLPVHSPNKNIVMPFTTAHMQGASGLMNAR